MISDIRTSDFERIIYVFQGGGSLGAYQVGLFQALAENHYHPDWILGTSIGSINASIIAGNPPEKRLEKLCQFWDTVTQDILPTLQSKNELYRAFYNMLSATRSIFFGIEHFFSPNILHPVFVQHQTPDQISYYVVEPLKALLLSLIDFDLINNGKVRLTLGAVEIEQGKTVYFDNSKEVLSVDHILATAALPPGFPAVKIGEKYYWDGGIYNNAPGRAILSESCQVKTLCILAHLFDSYGLLPQNLDDVLKRHKDIQYSSHYRAQIENYKYAYRLRYIVSKLSKMIPEALQKDLDIQDILDEGEHMAPIHFARFLYEAPAYERSSKDYEFSKLSMHERLQAGYEDVLHALETSPWFKPVSLEEGLVFHDFHRDPVKLAEMKQQTE